jgi:ribonuclease BN (tRNA processing enzyme)
MRIVVAVLIVLAIVHGDAAAQNCSSYAIAVQVLGSGNPRTTADRTSSSYLFWLDGHSRVLVDAGGGSFARFGQSNAKFDDLWSIAISHLHPDHVSDLPALLWAGNARKEPIDVFGPTGRDVVPGVKAFLSRLFDHSTGAFPMLSGTVGGPTQGTPLQVTEIDADSTTPLPVSSRNGLEVAAIGVPHGNVPALAYRIRTHDVTVVFSTDQTGTNPKFVDFARGADLLVMHMAIGAGATFPGHAAPAVVGQIARDAQAKQLVLSHIGQFDLSAAVADVKRSYVGPVTVATDLRCMSVAKN